MTQESAANRGNQRTREKLNPEVQNGMVRPADQETLHLFVLKPGEIIAPPMSEGLF